jgi:hypothetical protein
MSSPALVLFIFTIFSLQVLGEINFTCIEQLPSTNIVRMFCAYDGRTWTTSKTPQGLFHCGLSINYPGKCGCPNDCFNISGQGKCIDGTKASCQCTPGWQVNFSFYFIIIFFYLIQGVNRK